MSRPDLTPLEWQVLDFLGAHTDPGDWFTFSRTIAEHIGIDVREARKATRSLRRQGLAKHSQVFDEDTGHVAGSGYAISREGRQALATYQVE
jgi:DNA-binding MarR family transcriptional regulator